jgi:hypothetical protein
VPPLQSLSLVQPGSHSPATHTSEAAQSPLLEHAAALPDAPVSVVFAGLSDSQATSQPQAARATSSHIHRMRDCRRRDMENPFSGSDSSPVKSGRRVTLSALCEATQAGCLSDASV